MISRSLRIILTALSLVDPLHVVAQDTTPPSIHSQSPIEGELIESDNLTFDATVTDESGLRHVRFKLRNPSGERSEWFAGSLRDGTSDVYEVTLPLSDGGTWSYRVQATDVFRNSKQTGWIDFNVLSDLSSVVAVVRQEIEELIASRLDVNLSPKFVRLGFHDCVPDANMKGGCDGCVDLSNGDNAGLDIPIDALTPIVNQYATPAYGLSRADIWALAALVGSDVSQNANVPFPMEYIGRVDCENAHDICYKENGVDEQPCQKNRGPHRPLPGPDMTTSELLHWFSLRFDYSPEETTAIMGAHSIGGTSRENSGFDGEHGWVNNPRQLTNGYYNMICAPPEREGAISAFEAAMFAPAWDLEFIDNTDIGTPDRYQWFHVKDPTRDDDTINLESLVMLNTDIALVRDLEGYLDTTTGEVTGCNFRCRNNVCRDDRPRCPHAAQTFDTVIKYEGDNLLWLTDYSAALRKMLVRGYDTGNNDIGSCSEEFPCLLELGDTSDGSSIVRHLRQKK